ncbi:MAG: hypothetical protein EHM36_03275 [Deltaproteobacteria bacterium]|nr:MAG: hypothetical protein EHM36_03275 [Deltaproteobacteria bacterium]
MTQGVKRARDGVLEIDLNYLKQASKAEVVEAAQEIEQAMNSVPYMEIGDGYSLNVKRNCNDDHGIPFTDAVKAGHEEEVGRWRQKTRELEQKLAEKDIRIGELWDEIQKLRKEAADNLADAVRAAEEKEKLDEQMTREMKARSELLETLTALKTILNRL